MTTWQLSHMPEKPKLRARRSKQLQLAPILSLREPVSTVSIVTITLARTPVEATRLYEALRTLADLGPTIYVGEGGSSAEFIGKISQIPNLRVCQRPASARPGLVGQVQTAFQAAQQEGADYLRGSVSQRL